MKTFIPVVLISLVCATPASVFADILDPYAKANVSYDWGDGWRDSVDHASRIGVKGSLSLNDNTSVVYQVEQGVDLAHGGTDFDTLLNTRNSFIGIKGDFGTLFWGAHDTPLKKAQGGVDRFNDQQGDVKVLLAGEVRAYDAFGYTSPKIDGWQIFAMHVPSDNNFDSSQSLGVSYAVSAWKFGLGFDEDMRKNDKAAAKTRVYDSVRASVEYQSGNWSLGLVAQQSEQQNLAGADSEWGYVLSAGYVMGKAAIVAQHGESDIVASDARSSNIGLHYKWRPNFKTYLGYWSYNANDSEDQVSLGFEYKI